ncbi:hypothetical protein DPMN_119802 [Dreissena polymorpha]|uniref:Uncharacterized protein n=1 Tax=Dreissena polymorpha TaxID=45954 RepID=A0A9D4GMC6_DREPO|nr:hypothetical protein DPMN_119782 [Dreissena polymorpha]KAH3818203.1 hypothetical protein DPMN_119802 [Dreissena polymorpha]
MAAMAGVASIAQACSTLFGSSSGPAAFRTLMCFSSLSTPSSLMCSGGMSSFTRLVSCRVGWFVSSLVKTDWN